jgi:hypothetical protein
MINHRVSVFVGLLNNLFDHRTDLARDRMTGSSPHRRQPFHRAGQAHPFIPIESSLLGAHAQYDVSVLTKMEKEEDVGWPFCPARTRAEFTCPAPSPRGPSRLRAASRRVSVPRAASRHPRAISRGPGRSLGAPRHPRAAFGVDCSGKSVFNWRNVVFRCIGISVRGIIIERALKAHRVRRHSTLAGGCGWISRRRTSF